jgi:CBS domain-containing protein
MLIADVRCSKGRHVAKVRHLPVIENGELKGIVSIGDLVKRRLDEKKLEANVLPEVSRMRA